jgi:hypothetical protein
MIHFSMSVLLPLWTNYSQQRWYQKSWKGFSFQYQISPWVSSFTIWYQLHCLVSQVSSPLHDFWEKQRTSKKAWSSTSQCPSCCRS